MTKKCDENELLRAFIQNKTEETIRAYLVMFHLDESVENPLGCIRVDRNIIAIFKLQNNKTYDIYIKLKSKLSDDTFTRLILTRITSDDYVI